jgi:Rel/ankyrin family protein
MSPISANNDYNFHTLNLAPTYELTYLTDNNNSPQPIFSFSPTISEQTYQPQLTILEQPVDKFRFRYQSEMHGTHGSLMGMRTEKSKKTYPTVELRGFTGEAKIRCSLYQVDTTRRSPHSHHLVIKNGDIDLVDPHDVTISDEKGYKAVFQGMGIIHTAKKFIAEELLKKMKKEKETELNRELTLREEAQLQKEANEQAKSMNLNQVCLKFQAFIVDPRSGHWREVCEPVYSNAINNMSEYKSHHYMLSLSYLYLTFLSQKVP